MAKIPKDLPLDPATAYLLNLGYKPDNEGKVRNTFKLDEKTFMQVASDRLSTFDFVLRAIVPRKGEYLTAMTHFIMTGILKDIPNHLVPSKLNPVYNAAYDLKTVTLPDLPIGRCLVVRDLTGVLDNFELIFRFCVGGSVFKLYTKTGKIAGIRITPDLPKWSKLAKPLFTPSTKEKAGHDVNITIQKYYREMRKLGIDAKLFIKVLKKAYVTWFKYCYEKGIMVLDTKFEGSSLLGMIADEILTCDSSRYTTIESWLEAVNEGKEPIFLDKEVVRIYMKKIVTPFYGEDNRQIIGINNLDPKNPEHVEFVHSLIIPPEIIAEAANRYSTIFETLVGMSLDQYQKEKMGV